METAVYRIDDEGFPYGGKNAKFGPAVNLPVEIETLIFFAKEGVTYDNIDSEQRDSVGILADWCEEHRELLVQLNSTEIEAVDRMIRFFRSEWNRITTN